MGLKSPLKPDPQLTDRSFCCQHCTVAQAFSAGAFNFLRGYCPTLPLEGAATNSTPYQVMTGFAIEAKEEPSRFSEMPADNAEYAARSGLLELDGFPQWLPKLFGLYSRLIQGLRPGITPCVIELAVIYA